MEKETCHGRPHSEKLRLWLQMEVWGDVTVWVRREASKKSHPGVSGGPQAQPGRSVKACLCPPLTPRQQEALFHFLQLVAGVEHYQQKFRSQASIIDEIVDTAFEVNQAGPEGRGRGRGDAGRPAKVARAQKWPLAMVTWAFSRQRPEAQPPSHPTPQAGEEDVKR